MFVRVRVCALVNEFVLNIMSHMKALYNWSGLVDYRILRRSYHIKQILTNRFLSCDISIDMKSISAQYYFPAAFDNIRLKWYIMLSLSLSSSSSSSLSSSSLLAIFSSDINIYYHIIGIIVYCYHCHCYHYGFVIGIVIINNTTVIIVINYCTKTLQLSW